MTWFSHLPGYDFRPVPRTSVLLAKTIGRVTVCLVFPFPATSGPIFILVVPRGTGEFCPNFTISVSAVGRPTLGSTRHVEDSSRRGVRWTTPPLTGVIKYNPPLRTEHGTVSSSRQVKYLTNRGAGPRAATQVNRPDLGFKAFEAPKQPRWHRTMQGLRAVIPGRLSLFGHCLHGCPFTACAVCAGTDADVRHLSGARRHRAD